MSERPQGNVWTQQGSCSYELTTTAAERTRPVHAERSPRGRRLVSPLFLLSQFRHVVREESRIQASSIPQCASCMVSASVVRGFRDSAVPASP